MRIPLASYGWREVAAGSAVCGAGLALALWLLPPAALVPALAWAWVLAFFRDPERTVPDRPDALLCPADGTVADVTEVEPPGDFLPGRAVRIGTFMSIFNVHVNRSPVSGTVKLVEHWPGRYHDARRAPAARENEHSLVGIELDDGRRVLVRQVAGAVARRIVCAVAPGDRVAAGQRIGMIKFGSRVELLVPAEDQTRVAVRPGDRVKAGRDVAATYPSDIPHAGA